MKIAICVPYYGDVKARFSQCLAKMAALTAVSMVRSGLALRRPDMEIFFREAGPLEYKRTCLVGDAQSWGADYALFIDTDMTFPPDALLRLLVHDRPIVGCNYPARRPPFHPTAYRSQDENVWTTEAEAKSKVLEEVRALGLGFCLIQTQVFSALEGQQLFVSEVTPEGKFVRGEDVHFCNIARLAGFPIFIDHALSWQIGHIADRILTNAEAGGQNADSILPRAGDQ